VNAVRRAKRQFPNDPLKGVEAVYRELSQGPAEERFLLHLTTFEYRIIKELGGNPTAPGKKVSDPTKIYRIPLSQSRYRNVPVYDPMKGENWKRNYEAIPWVYEPKFSAISFVEAGQAFVIKISGVPTGTDKWGHFIQQGYWYFKASVELKKGNDRAFRDAFGTYMEGGPDADKLTKEQKQMYLKLLNSQDFRPPPEGSTDPIDLNAPGFYGWLSSGVVSYADKHANEAGYWFYQDLFKNWGMINQGFTFGIAAFFIKHKLSLWNLNEYHFGNENKYHPYMDKNVLGPKRT
jgi:hypothetical protein